MNIFASLKDFFSQPEWRLWPFGPGFGDTLLPSLARLLFVAALLGAIMLFLRLLFGPNGIWRDKELDAEAEEELRQEREQLKKLFENGEMDEQEYNYRLKKLQ